MSQSQSRINDITLHIFNADWYINFYIIVDYDGASSIYRLKFKLHLELQYMKFKNFKWNIEFSIWDGNFLSPCMYRSWITKWLNNTSFLECWGYFQHVQGICFCLIENDHCDSSKEIFHLAFFPLYDICRVPKYKTDEIWEIYKYFRYWRKQFVKHLTKPAITVK